LPNAAESTNAAAEQTGGKPAPRGRRAILWGVAASLGFLWLALRQVDDFGQAFSRLAAIDARLLLIPFAASIANLAIRPWRWRAIFPAETRPPFGACFAAVAAGNMANNFLPARGRRRPPLPARPPVDRRRRDGRLRDSPRGEGVRRARVDLGALARGRAARAARLGWPTRRGVGRRFRAARSPPWSGWSGAPRGRKQSRARWSRASAARRWATASRKLVGAFAQGLSATGSVPRLAWIAALTAAQWITEAWILAGFAAALGVDLTAPQAMVAAAIVGLGLMVPSAPGFVGTWEFFSINALGLFGATPENALAVALATHAWSLLATTALGLACAGRAGRSALAGGGAPEAA
jgi:uncharacterized membrane protein YbhN (UPF0104 family)